jgi:hypothetical protein
MARVKKWFAQMRTDQWQEWFDRAERLSKQLETCRISGVVGVDEDWETQDPEDLRYKVALPCLTFKQVEEVATLLNQPLPTKIH